MRLEYVFYCRQHLNGDKSRDRQNGGAHKEVVSIIQTYRPWTPRRTSGRIVHKKI